jgi:hypothetical protein
MINAFFLYAVSLAVCRGVCLSVAPRQLDGFYSWSALKILSTLSLCLVYLNIPAPEIGALQMSSPPKKKKEKQEVPRRTHHLTFISLHTEYSMQNGSHKKDKVLYCCIVFYAAGTCLSNRCLAPL